MPFRSTQRTTIQTVPFCKTSNGNVFLSSTVCIIMIADRKWLRMLITVGCCSFSGAGSDPGGHEDAAR